LKKNRSNYYNKVKGKSQKNKAKFRKSKRKAENLKNIKKHIRKSQESIEANIKGFSY
jgi:hypothetical protein